MSRFIPSIGLVGKVLDVLIALCLLFIFINTFHSGLLYRAGMSFFEELFDIFYYLLLARTAILIPWNRFVRFSPIQQLYGFLCGVAFVKILSILISVNLYSALEAVVATRSSFAGATDSEIAIDITENNKFYPRHSFLLRVKEAIPEDAAILYFSDQRPHIISYILMPRRVYVLPAMQIALNNSIQENWTWSPMRDPHFPQKDPLNPRVDPAVSRTPNPELMEEARRLIKEKNIKWVIYYDSLYPDRSWFAPIGEV
jgi:hypothetical protein